MNICNADIPERQNVSVVPAHIPSACPDVVGIALPCGSIALVDRLDLHLVAGMRWHRVTSSSGTHYAACRPNRTGRDRGTVWMHRLVLGLSQSDPSEGDHKNGDGLDNRRSNLRIATSQQNRRNRRPVSRFKGIHFHDGLISKPWSAKIQVAKRATHLGYFEKEEQAALAYDAAAVEHFGEFAHLNFPPEVTK